MGFPSFEATAAFVATWYRVEAFGSPTSLNTFQATLACNDKARWTILAYEMLDNSSLFTSGTVIGFNGFKGND